jgi:NADPH2:quinone reductase
VKAAFYDRQGPAAEVLQVGEVPTPEPGAGQVRVRVHVSGLNPTDTKSRTGYSAPMAHQRVIPHQDGAGLIDAVGEGVDKSRMGERVWIYEAQHGSATGTAAQQVVVPAIKAVPLPDNVSFDIGASLGIPAITAHRCLFADGDVRGKRVLVQGGAGVVGTAAILLAKWAGAWVATTVSSDEQAAIARINGADLVINRRTEDVAAVLKHETQGAGVDRIVEVDLKANWVVDIASIAASGTISTYATSGPSDELTVPLLKVMLRGSVLRWVFVYTMPADAKQAAVAAISECIAAGRYQPRIGLKVGLDQVVDAHEALEKGKVMGKVLIEI